MLVPSSGLALGRRRPSRLLGVLAVRDGMRYLPGFIRNVSSQVDGIVALDDGSRDGSAEFLAGCPEVIELLRVPADRPAWDEMGNHRALVAAALHHGAEWILSVDADERLECQFRRRAERVIGRGRLLGYSAYAVRLRELWDASDRMRVDGIWGRKAVARLFRARPDHEFDTAPLHGNKAPLQDRGRRGYPLADLNVYHLAMIRPEDRAARRRRYELADPERRWQSIGYEYLTDTAGLQLRSVPRRRGYTD